MGRRRGLALRQRARAIPSPDGASGLRGSGFRVRTQGFDLRASRAPFDAEHDDNGLDKRGSGDGADGSPESPIPGKPWEAPVKSATRRDVGTDAANRPHHRLFGRATAPAAPHPGSSPSQRFPVPAVSRAGHRLSSLPPAPTAQPRPRPNPSPDRSEPPRPHPEHHAIPARLGPFVSPYPASARGPCAGKPEVRLPPSGPSPCRSPRP